MNYKKLGNTDLDISTICLGTMTWGEQNTQKEGFEQMDYALDQGVNFWDTAELYAVPPRKETYGDTEEIIGNWFEKTKKRKEVILATKVAGPARDYLRNGENSFVLGLDVSTKTIGIALFENEGNSGKLKLLHHVTPQVKPKPKSDMQTLFEKARIFEEEFLIKYSDLGIDKVIIEEPLVRSNNVNTVATLLRFNGMISRSVYEILGVIPEFISSYDARKYAFPELMAKRTGTRAGKMFSENAIKKAKEVLFGGLPFDIDKKQVIFDKVYDLEPQVTWLYKKNKTLKNENFDMTDAYCCVRAVMMRDNFWGT